MNRLRNEMVSLISALKITRYTLLLPLIINGIVLSICYYFSTTFGHDTIFRSLMGWRWLQEPFYILAPNDITWVFGPLHCYVNALSVYIFTDPNIGPRLASTIFAFLALIPFYLIAWQMFGKKAAFYSSLAFPFYSLFVGLSVSGSSESLEVFFLLTAIYFLAKFGERQKYLYPVIFGIALTLAAATSYDIWLFIPLFCLYLLLKYFTTWNVKFLLGDAIFLILAMAFPLQWIIGSYLVSGDPLIFIHQVKALDISLLQNHVEIGSKYVEYNSTFPGVMLITLTPFIFLVALLGFLRDIWRQIKSLNIVTFTLILIYVYYYYNFVLTHTVILFSQYIVLQGVFLLLFVGYGFNFLEEKLVKSRFRIYRVFIYASMVAVFVLLGFYREWDPGFRGRLGSLSPVVKQPAFVARTVYYLRDKADNGAKIYLDAGNNENRYPYLKLFHNWNMVHGYFGPPDRWVPELIEYDPDYIVTSPTYSRIKKYMDIENDTLRVHDAPHTYLKVEKYGIYSIYEKYDNAVNPDSLITKPQ